MKIVIKAAGEMNSPAAAGLFTEWISVRLYYRSSAPSLFP